MKRLEAIEKERELEKKTSLENGLRDRVINKAGGLNVSNKALWGDVARQVAITEGMDDAKMEEETKRLYEAKLKEYVGEGATPYKSAGAGNDSEEASKSLDAFFANKAQEGKFPAKDKQ